MGFQRFEDIAAWQTARVLANHAYAHTRSGDLARDFALRDQFRKTAASIMANIVEGFSRRTDREFIRFLFVAKASAAELQSHLYLAFDQRYLTEPVFAELYDMADHCARQLSNLISHLRLTPDAGRRTPDADRPSAS